MVQVPESGQWGHWRPGRGGLDYAHQGTLPPLPDSSSQTIRCISAVPLSLHRPIMSLKVVGCVACGMQPKVELLRRVVPEPSKVTQEGQGFTISA